MLEARSYYTTYYHQLERIASYVHSYLTLRILATVTFDKPLEKEVKIYDISQLYYIASYNQLS